MHIGLCSEWAKRISFGVKTGGIEKRLEFKKLIKTHLSGKEGKYTLCGNRNIEQKETGLKETRKNKHQVRPMGIYYSKRVVQILQGDSTGSVLETNGRDIRLALERNIDNILATAE
jgi:hypothetical protein